jgi:hypothetical protein
MPRNTTHPLPAPRRLASSTSSQIPNATRATPISEKLKQQISSSVVNAEWSRGRRVIVNDDSISLFNAKDDMEISSSYETGSRSDYIPLRYLGLPVIPHHHAYFDPIDLPVLFTTSSTNSTPDHVGFSNQQIREMRDYFPGIQAIDYYIDGQVVVGLSQAFYGSAVEKVGYPFFKAWKYICVLVVIEGSNGDNTEDLDDLERSITPLSAGSKVWNLAGEYSTMGTFLHPDPSSASSSSLSVKYCSVSAHSFIRKIELGFFINPLSFAAMSLIVYLAYLGGKEGWGSAEVIQQILFLRMGFVLQGLVWKCCGRRLRWHIMVHFQEKLIWQTRTAGIQQSIPMTLWYAVFLIPRQARDILCTLVEAMLSLEGNTYYGSLRKIVVEILLTVWLVMWVLKKETKHAVLRNALSQTLRGTKDGNAEVLLPLLYVWLIRCFRSDGLDCH